MSTNLDHTEQKIIGFCAGVEVVITFSENKCMLLSSNQKIAALDSADKLIADNYNNTAHFLDLGKHGAGR